jgi:RpiR family transcriptional regulator, carbohydrate utilization regulator
VIDALAIAVAMGLTPRALEKMREAQVRSGSDSLGEVKE